LVWRVGMEGVVEGVEDVMIGECEVVPGEV